MNWADVIIILVLCILAGLVLMRFLKRLKKGEAFHCSSCGDGNCRGCVKKRRDE